MQSVLFTSIRTLLIDYAIEAIFGRIYLNFSNFDILSGCREFDRLILQNYNFTYIHRKDITFHHVVIQAIMPHPDFKILLQFTYKDSRNELNKTTIALDNKEIVECIPGKLLLIKCKE